MTAFLFLAMALGLATRLTLGRSLLSLNGVRLRGEMFLLALLMTQLLVPGMRLTGSWARLAYWIWVCTYPALIGVCCLNRRIPGIPVLGVGLALNCLVVVLNGGMPVSQAALEVVRSGRILSIPATDFVHVALGSSTALPWLADVLPVPGPGWIAAVASAGDCLLVAGIFDFLARVDAEVPIPPRE